MSNTSKLNVSINILLRSRAEAGLTQKELATKIGKSLSTVKNWESGYSSPTIIELQEWLQACKVNEDAYLLSLNHPTSDVDEILQALQYGVLTKREKALLIFFFTGNHGSEWRAQLELLTALNHLSMAERFTSANQIAEYYCLREQNGELICPDGILPDMDYLRYAIKAGKHAAYNKQNGYTTKED